MCSQAEEKALQMPFLRRVHESFDVITKNWLYGLFLCQNILAVN